MYIEQATIHSREVLVTPEIKATKTQIYGKRSASEYIHFVVYWEGTFFPLVDTALHDPANVYIFS